MKYLGRMTLAVALIAVFVASGCSLTRSDLTQEQAAATVTKHIRSTLNVLPEGSTLDTSHFTFSGLLTPCKDSSRGLPPKELSIKGQLIIAGDQPDYHEVVRQVGDAWKLWGWKVIQREDFRKPNRFAYIQPSGYSMHIVAYETRNVPPVLTGVSPCMPGEHAMEPVDVPVVITTG